VRNVVINRPEKSKNHLGFLDLGFPFGLGVTPLELLFWILDFWFGVTGLELLFRWRFRDIVGLFPIFILTGL
jgi:hypothetical protein